jgi:lysophospholipase L1-like esterase
MQVERSQSDLPAVAVRFTTFAILVTLLVVERSQAQPPSTQPDKQPTRKREFSGLPDKSLARTDANSQLAHRHLLKKAKARRIDVYFVGDSITRRWGTSDPQYAHLLKNWNANFYGWNAANFGWGADTTQNILWRLQNGELDGVNPEAIIILAGTNNVGLPSNAQDTPTDVARGIEAIVETCREKAPHATIILTAIFPRNDKSGLAPIIEAINQKIAGYADGKKVRFLNVNERLADKNGQLFDGVMNADDKLHPTVKGYQVWADGLKPHLTEILGPRAEFDDAPAPTGDPSLLKP